MVPLTLLITLVFTLMHSAVAKAERWRAPLSSVAVTQGFTFDGRTPFAVGTRRGVRLAGDPGETVRAPCSGRVAFAGRVPRLGSGLSLRCGALAATVFGLRSVRARRGAVVIAGASLGALGSRGHLWLAARVASERWAYRDPLALIGGADDRPLGPAPLPMRPRIRTPDLPPPASAPAPAAAGGPPPLAAWIGAAVAAAGAGLGVRLRRRPGHGRRLSRGPAIRRHRKTH